MAAIIPIILSLAIALIVVCVAEGLSPGLVSHLVRASAIAGTLCVTAGDFRGPSV